MNDDWPISSTARRNAACRAACEGIPTEALGAGVVADMLEALRFLRANYDVADVVDPIIARATGEKPWPAPAEIRVRCYRAAMDSRFIEHGTCIKRPDGSIDWQSWRDAE